MMRNSRAACVLLMMLACACDGGNGTPTAPSSSPSAAPSPPPSASPSPSPTPRRSIVLIGQVTDSTTSAPISGAIVSINGRYAATTNSSGHYSLTGLLDAGGDYNYTYVSANNYASDYRYIRATTQNVRLYRIERFTAGDSKAVTVAP